MLETADLYFPMFLDAAFYDIRVHLMAVLYAVLCIMGFLLFRVEDVINVLK